MMTQSRFDAPPDKRYFEHYIPGAVHEFGAIAVAQEEIIEFARRFDPQAFHIDPDAAKKTHFKGLVASGWHTAGLMMRLFAEHFLSKTASLGSPGVDELRWVKPVRPGDLLSIRVTVLETKRSRSKPDRGIVHSLIEVMNQNREIVMHMKAVNFLGCQK